VFLSASCFVALAFLEVYYAGHRPHTPQPTLEQTVRLPWTYPVSYGTVWDASLMQETFSLGFCSFGIIALGWAIRIYVLGDDIPIRGEARRFGRLTRDHTIRLVQSAPNRRD
jgi:hypothetical protein